MSGKVNVSSSLRLIASRLKVYGATISEYLDGSVTHVVVDQDGKPRPRLKRIRERITELVMSDDNQWRALRVGR